MAMLKLAEFITGMSGKIGGQSISNTRNGTVIKNIGQPPKQGSTLQMQQRSETAYITNKWQKLSVSARQSFIDTAPNYTWTNSIGDIVTRNGFQVFCFLNQNLNTLGLPLITTAPIYEAVPIPILTNVTTEEDEFVIQATNTHEDCIYIVFAQVHYSLGASTIENTAIIVGQFSESEITSGVNLVPYIESTHAVESRTYRTAIQVFAINEITGNKTLISQRLEQNIISPPNPASIFSYYNFNGNLNDYYNINNGLNFGATFTNNGVINNAVSFDALQSQYFILPNSETLRFYNNLGPVPFSFYFWTELSSIGNSCIFSKRISDNNNALAQFQFTTETTFMAWLVFGSVLSLQSRINYNNVLNTNQLYNIVVTYDGAQTVQFYLDGVLSGVYSVSLGFEQMIDSNLNIYFGKAGWNEERYMSGTISELGIFTGVLSESKINELITGNLNGLTIPQII